VTPGGYTLAPGSEWTDAAATWQLVTVSRETEPGHFMTDIVPAVPQPPLTQIHLCCLACDGLPSVFCLTPDVRSDGYVIEDSEIRAGILAHIRRSHGDVVAS